ncbi:MAG: NOP5/NOP56 family protein [Methanomassiliicoccales archaeon]
MYLITKWFGTFLISNGKVIDKRLFPRDPEAISKRLYAMQSGEILEEEKALASGKRVEVLESRLTKLGRMGNTNTSFVRGADFGYSDSLLKASLLSLNSMKLKHAIGPDRHIAEAVHALDELQAARNIASLRLRSWHSIHFPELPDRMGERAYVLTIAAGAERGEMMRRLSISIDSTGSDLTDGEESVLRSLASLILVNDREIERLLSFIETISRSRMPNLSVLMGPLLAARLSASAGGLERMARMPAGTIQLLGAEKALFRHMRSGRRPPKYGLIFQHPLIQSADRSRRGSIARHLAARAVIASRLDLYGGALLGEKLLKDVELFARVSKTGKRI